LSDDAAAHDSLGAMPQGAGGFDGLRLKRLVTCDVDRESLGATPQGAGGFDGSSVGGRFACDVTP